VSVLNNQVLDPWSTRTAQIKEIVREIDGVATYELGFQDQSEGLEFTFHPGQFNMLYVPGVGEAAISISSDPNRRSTLSHTVRVAGNVTGQLARMEVGATIGLRGPFGTGWPIEECRGGEVIIVTGGIGLAPLRPVIYELIARQREFGQVTLLYGARSPSGLLYTQEFDAWREAGINIQTTVDRASSDWSGNVGVVTQLFDRMKLEAPSQAAVLTCGPEVMMWFAARSARAQNIPIDRIWISLERNMNCAIGLCGHCQFGSTFVCKDGPVVRYDKVAPLLKVEGL